jgi:hypothetical protein
MDWFDREEILDLGNEWRWRESVGASAIDWFDWEEIHYAVVSIVWSITPTIDWFDWARAFAKTALERGWCLGACCDKRCTARLQM